MQLSLSLLSPHEHTLVLLGVHVQQSYSVVQSNIVVIWTLDRAVQHVMLLTCLYAVQRTLANQHTGNVWTTGSVTLCCTV